MQSLIIHTASLYYLFEPYEQTLDDRIHACLDAGLDGVEISNGPSILTWSPHPDTVRRLRDKTVTVHAEILWGITLDKWVKAIQALPFTIANTVFHPEELTPDELLRLGDLPFPASIENMDKSRNNWRTVKEVHAALGPGVGFTLDTAHAESNNLPIREFERCMSPVETHLSVTDYDHDKAHVLTCERPNDFPHVPSACPIVTIEGVVPSLDALETEVEFLRSRL